ncbi:MAG: magnesium transporter CorA family protein, partial [Candidatus Dormibacteraeota bacterium]|nr:magnesium transporter CorA family protein [Candidatus Dormibacteraeota bacterium]
MRTLETTSGRSIEPTDDRIAAFLAEPDGEGFWLDILEPGEDDYRLLQDIFHFHWLTIEDIREPNERPKLDEYLGYAFAVVFTASLEGDDVKFAEHHIYQSPRHVVTVHHEPEPALDALRRRIAESAEITKGQPGFLFYLILDTLVDAMFPALDQLDVLIDAFQDQIIERPGPAALRRIYDLKRTVIDVRRHLGSQRDLIQRLTTRAIQLDPETSVYYRDIYDHVIRQFETADSLRDLLTGTMDVYLSTVSNRQNSTMAQLTVVASLFLPLTFLSGFFGMNFGTLVGHISSGTSLALGVALM